MVSAIRASIAELPSPKKPAIPHIEISIASDKKRRPEVRETRRRQHEVNTQDPNASLVGFAGDRRDRSAPAGSGCTVIWAYAVRRSPRSLACADCPLAWLR